MKNVHNAIDTYGTHRYDNTQDADNFMLGALAGYHLAVAVLLDQKGIDPENDEDDEYSVVLDLHSSGTLTLLSRMIRQMPKFQG